MLLAQVDPGAYSMDPLPHLGGVVSVWSGWPSGLRRCVQVAVYSCRRGFESHF